jgi:hypothetical protein
MIFKKRFCRHKLLHFLTTHCIDNLQYSILIYLRIIAYPTNNFMHMLIHR